MAYVKFLFSEDSIPTFQISSPIGRILPTRNISNTESKVDLYLKTSIQPLIDATHTT